MLWAGAFHVWQGLDVVLPSHPSIVNYSGSGPRYDAFVLRLQTALTTSVKLSGGMAFEESY